MNVLKSWANNPLTLQAEQTGWHHLSCKKSCPGKWQLTLWEILPGKCTGFNSEV